MQHIKIPRIMLAASASGSGKTTITCGLLKALLNRNLKVASFKCGPDYIDTMFHASVVGTKARNLDTYFTDENTTRYLFCKTARDMDISVIEGVMGYYDGIGGRSSKASTYDVAKVTNTPVVLIMNASGLSVSLIALLKGMITYKKDSRIVGVILNQISGDFYKEMKEMIEEELPIRVLGYVPILEEFKIDSRQLGLITPDEVLNLNEKLEALSRLLEETIEIDELVKIANKSESIGYEEPAFLHCEHKKAEITIAVARDEAFQFYYAENLELLEDMGAKLQYFSPMKDKVLPQDANGLLLGGGYPENHARILAQNQTMRESIAQAIRQGMPCLAESGGFLYLQEELEDTSHDYYKVTGVIKGKAYKTNKLQRFGYVELHANTKSVLGDENTRIKGHEFHYWDCETLGNGFTAHRPVRIQSYDCVVVERNMAAGFPQLYYYSNPHAIYEFVRKCGEK